MRQNARLDTSKTQSYQGFASFMGVEMSAEEKIHIPHFVHQDIPQSVH